MWFQRDMNLLSGKAESKAQKYSNNFTIFLLKHGYKSERRKREEKVYLLGCLWKIVSRELCIKQASMENDKIPGKIALKFNLYVSDVSSSAHVLVYRMRLDSHCLACLQVFNNFLRKYTYKIRSA